MEKGFLADKNGFIKSSWVWMDSSPCPFPDKNTVCEGDGIYHDLDDNHSKFRDEFITKISERMVTRDELSVVSVNSGRIVLDNLVKQT